MNAILDYVVPLGIPLSSFEGAVAPRPGLDPLWTQQDRELAMAWTMRQARTCSSCGTRPEEWTEDRNAYTWKHRHCPGCEVLDQGKSQVSEHAAASVHVGLIPMSELPDDEDDA